MNATRQSSGAQFDLSAIVLAAGQSRRFGSGNKLLAEVNGRSLLQHVLDMLEKSRVPDVVIVTGHEAAAVTENALAANTLPAPRFVHNANFADGLSSSVRLGLAAVAGSDAALICLADMPVVTTEVVTQLVATARQNPDGKIVVPTYNGKRGNPVLIRKSCFAAMQQLRGDRGARTLFEHFKSDLVEVAVSSGDIHIDIDTPAEMYELKAR